MPACAAVVAMGDCCLATHHGPTGGSGETRSRLEVSVWAAQGAHGKAGGPFFMAALAKTVANSSSVDTDPTARSRKLWMRALSTWLWDAYLEGISFLCHFLAHGIRVGPEWSIEYGGSDGV